MHEFRVVCHVTCNVSDTSTSVETDALLVLVLLLTTGKGCLMPGGADV